jgi:hypothetical protein
MHQTSVLLADFDQFRKGSFGVKFKIWDTGNLNTQSKTQLTKFAAGYFSNNYYQSTLETKQTIHASSDEFDEIGISIPRPDIEIWPH